MATKTSQGAAASFALYSILQLVMRTTKPPDYHDLILALTLRSQRNFYAERGDHTPWEKTI